jgi:hypothetical protein
MAPTTTMIATTVTMATAARAESAAAAALHKKGFEGEQVPGEGGTPATAV